MEDQHTMSILLEANIAVDPRTKEPCSFGFCLSDPEVFNDVLEAEKNWWILFYSRSVNTVHKYGIRKSNLAVNLIPVKILI